MLKEKNKGSPQKNYINNQSSNETSSLSQKSTLSK
jgi:hypothetical protein